jgi:hypothetical protein
MDSHEEGDGAEEEYREPAKKLAHRSGNRCGPTTAKSSSSKRFHGTPAHDTNLPQARIAATLPAFARQFAGTVVKPEAAVFLMTAAQSEGFPSGQPTAASAEHA